MDGAVSFFLKSVDRRLDLLGYTLGNDLLGDNQIEDFTAGLLVEELDGILHQIGSFFLHDSSTFGIVKALFNGHTSEIHSNISFPSELRCRDRCPHLCT